MGRFSADQADNYGGSGGHGFFSLQNDKDVAQVRFMYNDMSDVCGYAVHQITINDKKRYVNCIREYNEPISKCPFCEARMAQQAKLFIPLYDIESDTVKIWERGKKFFGTISSICSRYAGNGASLVNHIFEIERSGKKGDTSTTYNCFEIQKDNTVLDDLPELPEIIGGLVLDKSADEMYYYLDEGVFPDDDSSAPTSRRREEEEVPRRRGSGRRGESF